MFDFDQPPAFSFIVHTPPQRLVSQHLSSLINTTELLVQLEIPPPASQPALLLLSAPFFLLSLNRSPSFPRSRIQPPSGHSQQRSARLLKGPDESATTIQWRQRCQQKKERRSEGEGRMKKNVWTCGQTASAISEGPNLVC